MSDMSLYRY